MEDGESVGYFTREEEDGDDHSSTESDSLSSAKDAKLEAAARSLSNVDTMIRSIKRLRNSTDKYRSAGPDAMLDAAQGLLTRRLRNGSLGPDQHKLASKTLLYLRTNPQLIESQLDDETDDLGATTDVGGVMSMGDFPAGEMTSTVELSKLNNQVCHHALGSEGSSIPVMDPAKVKPDQASFSVAALQPKLVAETDPSQDVRTSLPVPMAAPVFLIRDLSNTLRTWDSCQHASPKITSAATPTAISADAGVSVLFNSVAAATDAPAASIWGIDVIPISRPWQRSFRLKRSKPVEEVLPELLAYLEEMTATAGLEGQVPFELRAAPKVKVDLSEVRRLLGA